MKNINNQFKQLERIFGKDLVVSGPVLQEYGVDLTTNFHPHPAAVVFPSDINQIVELVKWANQNGTALVPSGGRTPAAGPDHRR